MCLSLLDQASTVRNPGSTAQDFPGKSLSQGRAIYAEAMCVTEAEPNKNQSKGTLECEGVR